MIKVMLPLLLVITNSLNGQELKENRLTDWSIAGLNEQPQFAKHIMLIDFGPDTTGNKPSDEALKQAIENLGDKGGVIEFGEGTFLFKEPIKMRSNIALIGAGADKTRLKFDLGGKGHCIDFTGKLIGRAIGLTKKPEFGDKWFQLNGEIPKSSYVFIREKGYKRVHNSWALNHFGQFCYVEESSAQKIKTKAGLRFEIDKLNNVDLRVLSPIKNAGIQGFKIIREDRSQSKVANIFFKYAVNCFVDGIESEKCNYSHLVASHSAFLKVGGCYFHHGFSYGSGGKAYGVLLHFSTSSCLVENNIFEHLRHSMILQAGANSNVFAYNYSIDPYWQQGFFPSNTAGDMVLHGNYPYLNLFEGNLAQNLVIDDSHGKNGQYNTFFRNRAAGTGITCIGSNASNKQNILSNEVTGSGLLGGYFIMMGSEHWLQYNFVGSEIEGINMEITLPSLYLDKKPEYFGDLGWPAAGSKTVYDKGIIPAKKRFEEGNYTSTDDNLTIKKKNTKIEGKEKTSFWKRLFAK